MHEVRAGRTNAPDRALLACLCGGEADELLCNHRRAHDVPAFHLVAADPPPFVRTGCSIGLSQDEGRLATRMFWNGGWKVSGEYPSTQLP
eukprot:3938590-Rhodomonas_salina.5